MKSKIFMILACVSVLGLAACGSRACGDEPSENECGTESGQTGYTQGEAQGIQTLEVNEWGITLHAKDVTSNGMTLVCTQSGGSPTGELNTGTYYILERAELGTWVEVDYTLDEDIEVAWNAVAWMIPLNDTVEWKVDWEWLYGSLESGHYRIGKEIMDFRGSGDYDKEMYYAEFEVVE